MRARTIPEYNPDAKLPQCPLCDWPIDDAYRIAGMRRTDWSNILVHPECWPWRAVLRNMMSATIVTDEGGDNRVRWHTFATAEATA